MTDTAYELVRGAFKEEHPQIMVDASDAYALSVFPFWREDERPDDYELEVWETGMYDGCPALRRVADGWLMVVRGDEATLRAVVEWVA